MFSVSSILADIAMQSPSPLADCFVNNTLVEVVPFLKQSFFQIIIRHGSGSGTRTLAKCRRSHGD